MRKHLMLAVALAALAVSCASPSAAPTAGPTASPVAAATVPPTVAAVTPTSTLSPTPSGPAVCTLEPMSFLTNPNIPPVAADDHTHGPADAAITLIEYADFQCPGCAAMASLRIYLEDVYGDTIRFVYRHFPLSFHTKAKITAEAVEAAGAQGKFFEMHDLLYARQQEWGQLSDADMEARLIAYAEELGLDTERFAQDLRDHTYLPRIEAQLQQAMDAQLGGTPSYIVNGVEYPINEIGLGPQQVAAFIRLLSLVPEQYTELPPVVTEPDGDYVATIETSKGPVVIELFADQAPTNVNNFAFLAEEGWYDGQAFFYVDPASAAYAGDPTNMGWGLPYVGYICGDEIRAGLTFDQPGMVAFYTPAPGRNSNLFFITTAARPDFNGKFTIIGRVTAGLDVVKSLTATRPDGPAPDIIKTIRIEKRS